MAGLEPDNLRSLYQTQFLKNPIDQQIQEGIEQNRLSRLLIERLHSIRKNYEELQIEQMKTHIDKIMSSKPVCVDFKVLNEAVDAYLGAVNAETPKLLNKRVVVNHDLLLAKPTVQRLVPVARALPVKTAILNHRRVSPPITIVHHQPHVIIPAQVTATDFDARQVRKPPSRTASLEKRPEPRLLPQTSKPEVQAKPTLKKPEADKPVKKRVTYEDELPQQAPAVIERVPEQETRAAVPRPATLTQPDPVVEKKPAEFAQARPVETRQVSALPPPPPPQPPKEPSLLVSDDFVPTGSKTDAPLTLDNKQPQTSLLATLPMPQDMSAPCSLNTINKDKLAVGSVTGAVCIFDLPSNTFTCIQLAPAPITVLRSLDGLLLAGQDTSASNIAIIDTRQQPPSIQPVSHSGAGVQDLHFLTSSLLPETKNLFVSLSANRLGLWSPGGEQPRKVVEVADQPLNCIAVFNNCKSLVAGGIDGSLRLLRVDENDLAFLRLLRDTAPVVTVDSFYNNSNFVISSNSRSEVKIWDTSSGE
jgi:hypothetical protein